MNGSSRARNASSLINQTNTSGGVKKAGLPSTVGLDASVSGIYRKRVGCASQCPFIISSTTMCSWIGRQTKGRRC
jgi:hypothetical protein